MFGNANFDDSTNTCYKPNITDQNQTPLVDFDDFQSLSETDDELDESNYRISESLFWSQSITPGKYYTRVFFEIAFKNKRWTTSFDDSFVNISFYNWQVNAYFLTFWPKSLRGICLII